MIIVVFYVFFPTLRLDQFISSNSDNRVQIFIVIGNTFILCQTMVVNVFLRRTLQYAQWFAMKPLSSLVFFSVFILRPIRPVTMTKHLVQEKFMEMSEIHCENIYYPYICTDSSRLVSVSP